MRATLPSVRGHFSRPQKQPRPQARVVRCAQCQNHFCAQALLIFRSATVKQVIKASEMTGRMLGRAVCSCEDGAGARACRSDKLAAWFTDSEWSWSTSRRCAPWLPGMPEKVFGAAPGAAAYRNRPPTVPGHQRDRPGTSGRAHRDLGRVRRALGRFSA